MVVDRHKLTVFYLKSFDMDSVLSELCFKIWVLGYLGMDLRYQLLFQSCPEEGPGWPVCVWPTCSGHLVGGLDSTTSTLAGVQLDLDY